VAQRNPKRNKNIWPQRLNIRTFVAHTVAEKEIGQK
jgi:hypothetical protein